MGIGQCAPVLSFLLLLSLYYYLITDLDAMAYCRWSLSGWYRLHSLAAASLQKKQTTTTTMTHLLAPYPGRPGRACNRKTFTHSLSLSGSYNMFQLTFSIYYTTYTAYSLHSCWIWQSFSTTSVQLFFGPSLLPAPFTPKSMHFSRDHSCPFFKHVHTISTYFAVQL